MSIARKDEPLHRIHTREHPYDSSSSTVEVERYCGRRPPVALSSDTVIVVSYLMSKNDRIACDRRLRYPAMSL